MKLNPTFWNSRYQEHDTGWDVGFPSTPLKEYFDQLEDKNQKILIPGCGNSYEGEYLHRLGFSNVFLIDFSEMALGNFAERVNDFPKHHLILGDFFEHSGAYDLIIEQTFFCAIDPVLRKNYAQKVFDLLKPRGRLVGLLFNEPLNETHPPFGGNKEQYVKLFSPLFDIKIMEMAYNSIAPRVGRELFIKLAKK